MEEMKNGLNQDNVYQQKKKYTGITKYYLKFTTFVLFNKKLLITQ